MTREAVSSGILRTSLAIAVGVMLLSFTPLLHAQVDTGSILGTVSDPSGAVIHDANITLTNEGTNSKLTTTAGEDGSYKFTPVRIGSYTVSASLQGFQTMTQRNVTVNVGAAVVIDFTLKPGQVTETVEVESTAPLLESQTSSVGQVVDSRSVNNLPL